MDTRKNAAALPASERDRLLEAFIRMKHRQAPGAPSGVSVYDRFVALHGAVFAVIPPGAAPTATVNFGHWNIGFLPWHRQYIRVFEKALQAEVPGVTLPYWDWSDHVGAVNRVFTAGFLGSLGAGSPVTLTNSVFRSTVPAAQRPSWWPANALGYRIHARLREGFTGSGLRRGSSGVAWPASAAAIQQIQDLVIQQPGFNPLWFFWQALEQGSLSISRRTHNTGHNFIGGHMSGGFSPNDPVFWFHHANVDRIWARWQANRLAAVPGSTHQSHWPNPAEESPFDGETAPLGHRLNDAMWPWVGSVPGYDFQIQPTTAKPLVPSFAGVPAVTVTNVLNITAMDYEYV